MPADPEHLGGDGLPAGPESAGCQLAPGEQVGGRGSPRPGRQAAVTDAGWIQEPGTVTAHPDHPSAVVDWRGFSADWPYEDSRGLLWVVMRRRQSRRCW